MRILLIAISLALVGCMAKNEYPPNVPVPTVAEATQAFRDALSLAAVRATQRAARIDGFYADPRIRIDVAEDPQNVQKRLRQVGLDTHLERSVLQLNRIAEETSLRAKPVFIKAITALDIDDPFEWLNESEDAGTRELMEQAYDDVYAQYLPIMSAALDQSSVRAYYRKLIERYNGLPLSFDIDPVLDEHLARKTVDGLFLLMADEEARIRRTPSARATREIDRLFRLLD